MLRVYSIKDEKSLSFNTPFFCVSDGVAVRQFTDLVNDEKSLVYKHPEDFSLWLVGVFDDQKGIFEPTERKHLLDASTIVHASYGVDGAN